MFKNSGNYAKFWGAFITWLVGAVPVVITFHTWQAVVAYAAPAIGGLVVVYLLPNTQAPGAQAAPQAPGGGGGSGTT